LLVAPQDAAGHPLTAGHVEAILDVLSAETEYLILDLPAVAGEAVRHAMERADQNLLVMEPEVLSAACAQADLETLKEWGLFDRVNLVVVSRSRSTTLMKSVEIEKQLGVSVAATLPPAPEAFHESARIGVPIVVAKPDELPARALIDLARWVAEKFPISRPVNGPT
jgi:MinD-like ATPase involved in chromosome partitioning or flagellar assembly